DAGADVEELADPGVDHEQNHSAQWQPARTSRVTARGAETASRRPPSDSGFSPVAWQPSTMFREAEYTQRIISEVLRKYPLLILMRRAHKDVNLGGVLMPDTRKASPAVLEYRPSNPWLPNVSV
ncbi:MAG: hypothetical protein ACRDTT_10120, partial [Pseudonocardiaceae bacterium]